MFSHWNLFSFSSSSLSFVGCDSMPYISSSKSGSVSGFLVLSHTFQNVQSCISNHSVPQITVSVVRQMAHNMHIAYIASCIHVKLKIATKLYHCWLYAVPRTCNHNIQWVRDISNSLLKNSTAHYHRRRNRGGRGGGRLPHFPGRGGWKEVSASPLLGSHMSQDPAKIPLLSPTQFHSTES